MTRDRIIERLSGYFRKSFRQRLKKQDSVRAMINRMNEKEAKLKKRLKSAAGKSERRLIEDKLKVLRAQRGKAEKLLDSN